MQLNEANISDIVKQVMESLLKSTDIKTYNPASTPAAASAPQCNCGDYGVFDKMTDAVGAAFKAQKEYVTKFQLKDRTKLIQALRTELRKEVDTLARMTADETGLGRYEDKIHKITLVLDKTPGTECLKTEAISGDDGLTIVEHAPYGVIGSITPTTNPSETIINNVISMIAGGNSVVFNVHPSAKKVCAYAVQLINKIIENAGGPKNLATMVKEPTMDTVKELSSDSRIKLLVGTGGMPMVTSLLKSGKKVIGAGAGNPPVIVDKTANVKNAAKEIFKGASFDNNIICLAEKEVFVEKEVYSDFIYNMVECGAFLLNSTNLQKIMDLVLTKDSDGYHISKSWVGKNAGKMLDAIGVSGKSDCRLLICEVEHNHPFVLLEQLMPVLPIVKCDNLDDAINYALVAEHGNRHTASMFSQNINNLTKFARAVETTIFVKNAATLAGLGFGGEGHTTMTIAGPTGEGITDAVSFTRQRRCVVGEGGFRII